MKISLLNWLRQGIRKILEIVFERFLRVIQQLRGDRNFLLKGY